MNKLLFALFCRHDHLAGAADKKSSSSLVNLSRLASTNTAPAASCSSPVSRVFPGVTSVDIAPMAGPPTEKHFDGAATIVLIATVRVAIRSSRRIG